MSPLAGKRQSKTYFKEAITSLTEANKLLEKAQDIIQRHVDEEETILANLNSGDGVLQDDQENVAFVADYIDQKVKKLPCRLIDLNSCELIKRKDLASKVTKSVLHDYAKELKTRNEDQWRKIMGKIDASLSYAILSHRWGDDEPLYKETRAKLSVWRLKHRTSRHIPENVAPGIRKLVDFCDTAQRRHYVQLAWSDTCCIDKTNDAELQESINSMFQWYSNAKLCIVHMAETEKLEDAKDSKWDDEWFTRCWTLQELLAPKVLKFYSRTWGELVGGSENDKDNEELMRKLENVTGITSACIKNFIPGPTNLSEKMKWASKRKTAREEDIAYSLLGIFGVRMQANYGEGGEQAFYRLQEQIIRITHDKSLFDWYGEPSRRCSMIASKPHCFSTTNDILRQPYPVIRRSLLADVLLARMGMACLSQTFSCGVDALFEDGTSTNEAETHFTFTKAGLQLEIDTIRVLRKWRRPRKDGFHRWHLTVMGHKRVEVAVLPDVKRIVGQGREFILVPLSDEGNTSGRERLPRVALLLYKVFLNTWARVRTKDPIMLVRNKFNPNEKASIRTIDIR